MKQEKVIETRIGLDVLLSIFADLQKINAGFHGNNPDNMLVISERITVKSYIFSMFIETLISYWYAGPNITDMQVRIVKLWRKLRNPSTASFVYSKHNLARMFC